MAPAARAALPHAFAPHAHPLLPRAGAHPRGADRPGPGRHQAHGAALPATAANAGPAMGPKHALSGTEPSSRKSAACWRLVQSKACCCPAPCGCLHGHPGADSCVAPPPAPRHPQAQFVARNGKSFLTGLASREHANPQVRRRGAGCPLRCAALRVLQQGRWLPGAPPLLRCNSLPHAANPSARLCPPPPSPRSSTSSSPHTRCLPSSPLCATPTRACSCRPRSCAPAWRRMPQTGAAGGAAGGWQPVAAAVGWLAACAWAAGAASAALSGVDG